MNCPTCKTNIPDKEVLRAAMSIAGKKGKGKSKARTSAQARAAVMKRWENVRKQVEANKKEWAEHRAQMDSIKTPEEAMEYGKSIFKPKKGSEK